MSRYLNSPREADWYACPFCGDEVRVGSDGCPKCSSASASTSSPARKSSRKLKGAPARQKNVRPDDFENESEGDWPDGLELPDGDDFDYEEWKKREYGLDGKIKPHGFPWKYWFTAILLLVLMIWGIIAAGFFRA